MFTIRTCHTVLEKIFLIPSSILTIMQRKEMDNTISPNKDLISLSGIVGHTACVVILVK